MRIVHILASFEVGGAEQVALRLATAQKRDGHDTLLVALAPGSLIPRAREAGHDCLVVHKSPRFDPLLSLRLARLLRDERADVVHSHNPQALVYAAPAARLAGAASVHTKHGEARQTARRMMLLAASGRLAHAFVCVSEATRGQARQSGEAPGDRLEVIDNGIDTHVHRRDESARAVHRAALGIDRDAFAIGTVGRLSAVKNQSLLLRAAAPMLGSRDKVVLVGDGPERESLALLARALGCADHVVFTGARDDVPALLNAFDVLALSSHTEGLPLVLLEAMATELGIVATDVGGMAAALGSCGRVVPPGDHLALAAELVCLRANPELRASLGAAARARACERYSMEGMHRAYAALYERVTRR